MAGELDRKLMPGFVQTAFTIWLGAAYKGFEMTKNPIQSAGKVASEMKSLVTVPEDSGPGIESKLKAVVAVWAEKGATLLQELKTAGEQFTEGK